MKRRTIEVICRERSLAKERRRTISAGIFKPGAAAHVKGLLGEGNSSGLGLKGKTVGRQERSVTGRSYRLLSTPGGGRAQHGTGARGVEGDD